MVNPAMARLPRKCWPFGPWVSCTSGIYLEVTPSAKLKGMRRPRVQRLLGKAVGALLLFASLAILVGCQGLSAGKSGQDQQLPGTLNFGSATLNFGSVAAGTSKSLTVTATNTGGQTVTISGVAISTNNFSLLSPTLPVVVSAGQSVNLTVLFTPSGMGSFAATATITSDASNTTATVALSGTGSSTDGSELSLTPASDAFGSVPVGGVQPQVVTLTNNGGNTVNITQASISGTGFQLSGITTPLALNPSQSTTFTVAFAPVTTGSANGSVTITSDGTNPTLTMELTGVGVSPSPLGAGPTSLSFGTVQMGNKQTLSETLTNTGTSSITISQLAITGQSGFSMSGITAPLTLTAGQSTTFSVSFAPSAAGAVTGNIAVTSNASNSTLNISLSATGAAPGPLTSSPASVSFGTVPIGVKQTLSETVTNTGGSSLTISQVGISGQSGFSFSGISTPLTLAAGQSAAFSVSFDPTLAGAATGNITVTSNASNSSLTIPLSGTGATAGPLTTSPSSVSFGSVTVGNKQTISETVTNTGGSSVTISQVGITGQSGFSFSGITAPVTVAGGQSTTFSVSFAPSAAGAVTGTIAITSNGSNPSLAIPLSGTGTSVSPGVLGSNPGSLSFGSVQVGNKQTLSETVTNTGGTSVTISQVGATGTGFSVSGISTPVTLTAGQSTTFSVSFTPASAGVASGNVTVTSNASNPTLTIPLSGSGVTAGALGSNPASLSFGSVQIANKQTLSETVTNTGGTSVTISQIGASGAGFSVSGISTPVTLTAGQSTTFSVSFTPASAGAASGNVTVTSNASNPTLAIPLSGTGIASGALGSNPSSLSFGSVQLGNNQSLSETVTNTGGTSVTISQVGATGTGFSVSGISAPVTLTSGQSATFSVSFTPSSAGAASGNVTVTSNASNPTLTIPLSGTGITAGALGSNPSSLSFGSVQVATKRTLSETVTNNGGSSVIISQVAISGTGFSVSGVSTPVTLASGQTATFSVSFTPSSAGVASGNLTVTSNASNPTLTIPLSGTGITAGVLGSNPSNLSFGSVQVGNNQSLSETVTNTGGSSVTISQVAASGTGFSVSGISSPVTLTSGQSATFSVSFTPSSAGAASGNVTITSNASNPTLTIPLSGTGVAVGTLGSNPTSLSFGSVAVGSNRSLSETVTNTGGSSVTISQVAASGTGFSVSGISTPVMLTAGQSATFSVSFSPSSAGTASGNVTVTSNASNPTLTIPLSGTATAASGTLGSNPTSLSFGSVAMGANQSLSETVTNTGSSSVTISQVAASGTGFSVSGISTPVTLTAGQSATFSVSFNPSSAGTASGNVTVTSNASNPTLNVPLSGTGVAAGALGSNPTSVNFGSVTAGDKQTVSETVTNTGSSSITISQVSVSGSAFSVSGIATPVILTAGQSSTFSISFNPTTGSSSGNVTVTSNASNPTLTIPLSGAGVSPGTLVSNPTTLSFGSVPVASTQTLSETLTNAGGGSVTISQVSTSGTGFSVSGISAPVTLTSGQSTTFSVSFTPSSAGAVSGDVIITSNASDPTFVVPLSGTGTATAAGQLTVNPTTLAVGSVVVGASGTATGTLTASGASVKVTGASSTSGAFSISGLSLPLTIPAGQSASFTVTFTPQTTGAASGTLTFVSNAQPTTTTEAVTGTGTAAPAHSVNLSWNASNSNDVVGYNVYRSVYANTCGSLTKINSTLETSTAYTDSGVTDGTSYCYATTAVDSNNLESAYSNIVSNLQIPAP